MEDPTPEHDQVATAADAQEQEPRRRRSEDLALSTLVALFDDESGESSTSLTLSIKGTVLTGRLVSRKRWWDTFTDQSNVRPGTPAADWLKTFRDAVVDAMEDTQSDADDDLVHLINAGPVMSNGVVGEGKAHWRVPLHRIDAWSFGGVATRA